MKLNKIPKSELELLPYTEIAKMYLKENKKTKNTADLFKSICNLLDLSESRTELKQVLSEERLKLQIKPVRHLIAFYRKYLNCST